MLKVSKILHASVLTLWHGGNLEETYGETLAHKKGRWEYGPGLYLTTNWETARKYAKGSRKLYRVTISSGQDARETTLPLENVLGFVRSYAIKAKLKDVEAGIQKYAGNLKADTFLNILINRDSIKSSDTGKLREFLVANGVDYEVVDNAFGWGERMVVLFNMAKVIKKEIIGPKTKVDTYDLPVDWAEE